MSNYKSCNLCNSRCEAGVMRNIPCDPCTVKDKEEDNNVNKVKPMVPEDQKMVIWYQEREYCRRSN